jgi:hypothetical protein
MATIMQVRLRIYHTTNKWVQVGFGCNLVLDKRREMFFAFCLYGMEYVINVGGPSIQGYEEWLKEHNHISPLVELGGHRLVKREEHGTTRFYLEEDHIELKCYLYLLRSLGGCTSLRSLGGCTSLRSLGGCRIQNDMEQAKCFLTANHICHKRFG